MDKSRPYLWDGGDREYISHMNELPSKLKGESIDDVNELLWKLFREYRDGYMIMNGTNGHENSPLAAVRETYDRVKREIERKYGLPDATDAMLA